MFDVRHQVQFIWWQLQSRGVPESQARQFFKSTIIPEFDNGLTITQLDELWEDLTSLANFGVDPLKINTAEELSDEQRDLTGRSG